MPEFKPQRRRFIAGATCPECGAVDRIAIDLDSEERGCVACGFREKRPTAPAPDELKTRVSRPAARRVDTPAEVVTLVDPGRSRKL
jgi:uncharacterized metal-binding protein (TIGR02443 family)